MKKSKKWLASIFCVLFVSVFLTSTVCAVSNSVDLIQGDSASYSDDYFAYGAYINYRTKNHSVSKGDMRAQFEYRKSYSLNWISDERVFIAPGASSVTKYSSQFNGGYHWRLALSPRNSNEKVSGVGTIYYVN